MCLILNRFRQKYSFGFKSMCIFKRFWLWTFVSCILEVGGGRVFSRQWPLTTGAQDVLWSRRHGFHAVLTEAVLPVKGHPVTGRERSSVKGRGQRKQSVIRTWAVALRWLQVFVCLRAVYMGFNMTGSKEVDVRQRSMTDRRPSSQIEQMWRIERLGHCPTDILSSFWLGYFVLHLDHCSVITYLLNYCIMKLQCMEVSSPSLQQF